MEGGSGRLRQGVGSAGRGGAWELPSARVLGVAAPRSSLPHARPPAWPRHTRPADAAPAGRGGDHWHGAVDQGRGRAAAGHCARVHGWVPCCAALCTLCAAPLSGPAPGSAASQPAASPDCCGLEARAREGRPLQSAWYLRWRRWHMRECRRAGLAPAAVHYSTLLHRAPLLPPPCSPPPPPPCPRRPRAGNWTLVSEVLSLSLSMQGIHRPPAMCKARFRQITVGPWGGVNADAAGWGGSEGKRGRVGGLRCWGPRRPSQARCGSGHGRPALTPHPHLAPNQKRSASCPPPLRNPSGRPEFARCELAHARLYPITLSLLASLQTPETGEWTEDMALLNLSQTLTKQQARCGGGGAARPGRASSGRRQAGAGRVRRDSLDVGLAGAAAGSSPCKLAGPGP